MHLRIAGIVCISALGLVFACSSDDEPATPNGTSSGTASSSGSTSGSTGGTSGATSSGGTSSGSTSGGSPCAVLASNNCERLFSCVPKDLKGRAEELSACKTARQAACERTEKLNGVTKLGSACAPPPGPFECASDSGILAVAKACNPAGALPANAACEDNRQCASLNCVTNATGVCGTCKDKVPADGTCGFDDTCTDGLACVGGKCKTPLKAGDACEIGECAEDLTCQGATLDAKGVCGPFLGKDASCAGGKACDPLLSLFCQKGKCEPPTFVPLDGTCKVTSDEVVSCIGTAGCQLTGAAGNGTCEAQANEGQTCNDDTGPSCRDGYECISGKCATPPVDRCK